MKPRAWVYHRADVSDMPDKCPHSKRMLFSQADGSCVLARRRTTIGTAVYGLTQATPSQMKDMIKAWRKKVSAACPPAAWLIIEICVTSIVIKMPTSLPIVASPRIAFASLLNKLIELPIGCYPSGVARPASSSIAVVNDLLEAFEQYKETDEYKEAVNNSKKRMDDQERTSQTIWWAKINL